METGPSLEIESWPEMFFQKIIKSLLTSRRSSEDLKKMGGSGPSSGLEIG